MNTSTSAAHVNSTTRCLRFMVGLACVIGITALSAFGQPSKSIEGTWNGEIDVPGVPLKTTVRLNQVEGDKWSGQIDIPQQGAKAVALTDGKVTTHHALGVRFASALDRAPRIAYPA